MATSSIFNNVKITDRKFCRSLIRAMEDSKKHNGKEVTLSRKVEELNVEQIEKIFGEERE